MKRVVLISILSLLICTGAAARRHESNVPCVTFGAEWSYSAAFLKGYHYYFIAPEGFRIEERDNRATFHSNCEVYLHAGYNLNGNWNLSLYAGYAGIGDFHTGIPVSLRMTRFFGNDPLQDRWFAYCDIGSGISIKKDPQELLSGKIGVGYRLSMSKYTKVDFIAALRCIHTHPDIEYFGEKISLESVSRSSGYIISASVGIGITF